MSTSLEEHHLLQRGVHPNPRARDPEVLKLLLAEKTYIERRLNANLDLQHKVIAVGFAAMVTALGWVFSTMSFYPRTAKSWSCWRS
jgi:hypothetical protein